MVKAILSAKDARTISMSDKVLYNEIDGITRAIYDAAIAGNIQCIVDDNTPMTDSSPTITVVGTNFNPVVGVTGEALTIQGVGISLPANADVDGIIAAINNAVIAQNIIDDSLQGLVAYKDAVNRVVFEFDPPKDDWTLTFAADSGNTTVGVNANAYEPVDPSSLDYYAAWIGNITDRKITVEFNLVIDYFRNLGYTIIAKKNTDTNQTIFWELYW